MTVHRLVAAGCALVLLLLTACTTEAAARDRLAKWAIELPGVSEVEATPMSGPGGSRGIQLEASVADVEGVRTLLSSYQSYIEDNVSDFAWWDARVTWPVEGGVTVAQLTPGEDVESQLEWGNQPLPEGVSERRLGFSTFSIGTSSTPGPLGVELQASDPVAVAQQLEELEVDRITVGADIDHYIAASTVEDLGGLADALEDALQLYPDVRYQGSQLVLADGPEAIRAAADLGEEHPWVINGGNVTIEPGDGTADYFPAANKWQDTARRIIVSERGFEVWMRSVEECNAFLDDLPGGHLTILFDCLDETHRMRMVGNARQLSDWRPGLERLLETDIVSVQYSVPAVRVHQRSDDWEEPIAALRDMEWRGPREVELSTETATVTFTSTSDGPARNPHHLGEPIEEDSDEAAIVQAWNDSQR